MKSSCSKFVFDLKISSVRVVDSSSNWAKNWTIVFFLIVCVLESGPPDHWYPYRLIASQCIAIEHQLMFANWIHHLLHKHTARSRFVIRTYCFPFLNDFIARIQSISDLKLLWLSHFSPRSLSKAGVVNFPKLDLCSKVVCVNCFFELFDGNSTTPYMSRARSLYRVVITYFEC